MKKLVSSRQHYRPVLDFKNMVRVFVDFDGTITTDDVGDTMFERFGGQACVEFVNEYREKKISAVECFRKESHACGEIDQTALDAFLEQRKIDPAFASFVEFCSSHSIECMILSDGMDYYIRRILEYNHLTHVRFFANHLDLVPVKGHGRVRFEPSFPYSDETCDRCACCKRNHMLTLSADKDILVYVGEGYSDRCPAKYADVVFAKDELLRYCRSEGIQHYEYRSFADVRQRLEFLLQNPGKRHGLHKRRQAERARDDVFIGE